MATLTQCGPRNAHSIRRSPATALALVTLAGAVGLVTGSVPGGASELRAQESPAARAETALLEDDPLRGGTFEFGGVVGAGSFEEKSQFDSCLWVGARVGHRFAPLKGNPRFRLGFRTGWETCATEHAEIGRVDLIHISATVLFGYRTSRTVLVYWAAGLGELLGDSTPGPDNQVVPRFSGHAGPGFTWALGRHAILDASVIGILFEGFSFGADPARGTTLGLVPNVMLALQI